MNLYIDSWTTVESFLVNTIQLQIMDGERIVLTSGNSLEPLCILAIVVLISADLDIGLVLLDAESVVDTKAKNDHSHQQGIHHRSPIFSSSPKWDESNLET